MEILQENKLKEILKKRKIKAFAFDVDGVMTNGGVFTNIDGELLRTFNAKDGFGLRMAGMNGYQLAIVTGGRSKSITRRFLSCGVREDDIYLNSRNKINDVKTFCKKHNISPDEILFMGDDLPDVPAMKFCGIGACPSDAMEEVKEAADYISSFAGGLGAVRETIQNVMKTQGDWNFDVSVYEQSVNYMSASEKPGE